LIMFCTPRVLFFSPFLFPGPPVFQVRKMLPWADFSMSQFWILPAPRDVWSMIFLGFDACLIFFLTFLSLPFFSLSPPEWPGAVPFFPPLFDPRFSVWSVHRPDALPPMGLSHSRAPPFTPQTPSHVIFSSLPASLPISPCPTSLLRDPRAFLSFAHGFRLSELLTYISVGCIFPRRPTPMTPSQDSRDCDRKALMDFCYCPGYIAFPPPRGVNVVSFPPPQVTTVCILFTVLLPPPKTTSPNPGHGSQRVLPPHTARAPQSSLVSLARFKLGSFYSST